MLVGECGMHWLVRTILIGKFLVGGRWCGVGYP